MCSHRKGPPLGRLPCSGLFAMLRFSVFRYLSLFLLPLLSLPASRINILCQQMRHSPGAVCTENTRGGASWSPSQGGSTPGSRPVWGPMNLGRCYRQPWRGQRQHQGPETRSCQAAAHRRIQPRLHVPKDRHSDFFTKTSHSISTFILQL